MGKPLQQDLKHLLAKGKTQVVLESLLSNTKNLPTPFLYNEAVLQSAKFERYQEIVREGVFSSVEMQILFSKINVALIQLIDKLQTQN